MSDIDHEYTDNPVCPYCGYEDQDGWELNLSDGEETTTDCGSCEGLFRVSSSVSVTYSTEPTTELAEAIVEAKREINHLEGTMRILSNSDDRTRFESRITEAKAKLTALEAQPEEVSP